MTIDDRTVVAHPFTGAPLGTPAQILRAAGFPGRDRQRPVRRHEHAVSRQGRSSARARTTAWRCGSTTGDALNENTEPFGGITAQQPRRRARRQRLHRSRPPRPRSSRRDGSTSCGSSSRIAISSCARSTRLAAAHADRRPRRSDAGSHRLRQCGPPALHAAAHGPMRCSSSRHGQPFDRRRISSRPASMSDFTDDSPRARRCRCTSADAISSSSSRRSPACCPRRSSRFRRSRWACRRRMSRATASIPTCTTTATSRCSSRTTGGSDRSSR